MPTAICGVFAFLVASFLAFPLSSQSHDRLCERDPCWDRAEDATAVVEQMVVSNADPVPAVAWKLSTKLFRAE
jgi:hypothetical protein